MNNYNSVRKNPSRTACEHTIKRILTTEVLEHGRNLHFKTAADFMNYFESLYPASDALTKQVQRAVKSLDMPRDEHGFFIVNKTVEQLDQEKELSSIFQKANVSIHPMEQMETIFLTADPHLRSYLIHLLENTKTLENKFITILETNNGLLIFTENRHELLIILNSLTI